MLSDIRERPVLTIPEAGEYLGLSRAAAYRAAQRGDLPGVLSVGRRRFVSTAILLRWLESGEVDAA